MACKDTEVLQISKFNISLDDNSTGPNVYVTRGRVLGTYIFWCCGQQGAGMGWKVATPGVGQSVRGLISHCCFSRPEKEIVYAILLWWKEQSSHAPLCLPQQRSVLLLINLEMPLLVFKWAVMEAVRCHQKLIKLMSLFCHLMCFSVTVLKVKMR